MKAIDYNMRIFYASATSPNAMFQSDLWRNNLLLPLVDSGHEVVEFDCNLYETFRNVDSNDPEQKKFIEKNRPKLTEELLRQLKAAHARQPLDVFFSYFYDACILPEALDVIRLMGIITVNWYCNGSYQLHLVSEIAPHYDWCLVPEKFRLKDYFAMNARPLYCQEAANPQIYKPYDLPLAYDVTFVGQAYGDRPAHVRHLLEQEIDVRVWGYGWQQLTAESAQAAQPTPTLQRAFNVGRQLLTPQGWQTVGQRLGRIVGNGHTLVEGADNQSPISLPAAILGGTLSDVEMIQMYSRSKINLGFSTCGNTHQAGERIVQIRLRDFEVPMSGGFYMVEYMEELAEFFEIGKEIICYSDAEELSDKIKYYLRHDSEREAIRQAGYERCRRDHTWQKRFATAFAEMGLS